MADSTRRGGRRRRPGQFRRRLQRLSRAQRTVLITVLGATAVAIVALIVLLRSSSPSPEAPLLPPPVSPLASPAGQSVLPATRIQVPSVGIDLPVVEGDGVHVPLFVASHYPGTGEPGGGTNSAFYAHDQRRMFFELQNAHLGDEVIMVRADGTRLRYRISAMHRVPWSDRDVFKPTPFEEVTLYTCTGYDPHGPRLTVLATPT